jgi:hypothetical protein
MKKDTLLINYSIVTAMDRKDHQTEDGKYMDFSDEIEEAIRNVAKKHDQKIEHYSDLVYVLNYENAYSNEPDNAGRCIKCDDWVSALNLPNIFTELSSGAEYDGKLYCQQHLPKESPMYSKLFPKWEREDEDMESSASH